MKTNMKLMAMAAVALLSLNACSDDNDASSAGGETFSGTPVEFEMSVNNLTRSTTDDSGFSTVFESGDVVGIFVYDESGSAVFSNCPYEYNGSSWEAQGTTITVPEDAEYYKYYAYYPYDGSVTSASGIGFTVASDQTEGYDGENDPLMAKNESVDAGATTVMLRFTHVFALVQVTLDGDDAEEGASVTLHNVLPSTTVDLLNASVGDASGDAVTVSMKSCDTNGSDAPFNFRAVVPAQTIAAGTELFSTTSNGKTYVYTYSADVPYESGKYRQINVTLGEKTEEITVDMGIDSEIEDWEASDPVDGEGTVTEVVESVVSLDLGALISSDMSFVELGTWSVDKLTDQNDYWFTRTSDITVVSYDAEEDAILAENSTDRGLWNSTSFGYHCGTGVFDREITYRLTFDMKSTIEGNQVLAVGVRNSDDTKGFRISNRNSGLRNLTAFNVSTDQVDTYFSCEVDVDFTKASTTTNLNNNEFEDTEDSDVNGITILFFTYRTAGDAYSVYIKDIVFEQVTE